MATTHIHHIIIDGLSAETAAATLGSAVAQAAAPNLTIAVTVIIDSGTPPPDAVNGEDVRILHANAAASRAARANQAAGSLTTATSVRFLHDGEILMPRASLDDVAALDDYPWCTSSAAEADGTTIRAREPGIVEIGTVLDEWAQPTVSLTMHPNTAAYRFAFFAALGGFSGIPYAHQAELLARANEASHGLFRDGSPSMTLAPTAVNLQLRPPGFGSTRRAIADMLVAGRRARIHSRRIDSGPQLWDDVSNAAWPTHTEGNDEVAKPSDDLWDVLTMARKYHYRFAWDALVTYAESAAERFDDDYLTAMLLTGRAARHDNDENWHAAVDFISTIEAPRLAHLFLTVVFETGCTTPWVLTAAIRFTDRILEIDPDDPVAHYRMVSFHRFLQDWPTAARWRRKTLDRIATVDPVLQNHLRERMIVETTAILPHLKEDQPDDASDSNG